TIVTGQTTIPSVTGETGETSATTGIIGTGSSQSQGIGTGFTSGSTVEGSTSTYTVVTTGTGSTTQAVSGTTTMRCEEMQAVDEAVSKKITVKPKELPKDENLKFQPTSPEGVSFDENNLKPTITVQFDKP
ncbi:unnamed protein product, partial [Rotaria sp. Silwood1]